MEEVAYLHSPPEVCFIFRGELWNYERQCLEQCPAPKTMSGI